MAKLLTGAADGKGNACPQCGRLGTFGYRNNKDGSFTWYCAEHRVAQLWADARRDDEPPASDAVAVFRSAYPSDEQRTDSIL